MKDKITLKIIILALLFWQAGISSGFSTVSRSVSYKLSVTIPPHVHTVNTNALEQISSIEELNAQSRAHHQDYLMEEIIRAEETILLRTFVVR